MPATAKQLQKAVDDTNRILREARTALRQQSEFLKKRFEALSVQLGGLTAPSAFTVEHLAALRASVD